jgi:hypothetical protein
MTFKVGDKVMAVQHGPGLAGYTGEGTVSQVLELAHPTYVVSFANGSAQIEEQWLEPVNTKVVNKPIAVKAEPEDDDDKPKKGAKK